jgi:uncharacterized membrane protein YtjA (UPF0391 family)
LGNKVASFPFWIRLERKAGRSTKRLCGITPTRRGFAEAYQARGQRMLKWALFFFIVSVIAGFFGFSGVAAASAGMAKILFFIAIAIFLILLVLGLLAGEAIL